MTDLKRGQIGMELIRGEPACVFFGVIFDTQLRGIKRLNASLQEDPDAVFGSPWQYLQNGTLDGRIGLQVDDLSGLELHVLAPNFHDSGFFENSAYRTASPRS